MSFAKIKSKMSYIDERSISAQHSYNFPDRLTPNYLQKISQCHFVHPKSQRSWSVIENGPSCKETPNNLSNGMKKVTI